MPDNSGFDIRLGGIDPRTDFTRLREMGIDDEEIARRLQVEEFIPEESRIPEEPNHIYEPEVVKELVEPVLDTARERTLREKQDEINRLRSESEQAHRNLQQVRIDDQHKSFELDRQRREMNRLREIPRYTSYTTYDPIVYTRLYDWGLNLIPSYYSYNQRKRYEELLQNLIQKELLSKMSESELERKIKQLISESPKPIQKIVKKPSRKPARKPSKKSSRKTSKKPSRKSAKKPSRKSAKKTSKKTSKKVNK